MDPTFVVAVLAVLVPAAGGAFAAIRSLRPKRISEYDVLLAKYTALVSDLEKVVIRLKEENDKLSEEIRQLRMEVRKLGGTG